MIDQLRKRHLGMWGILAVIIPVGFYLAIQAIPMENPINEQVINKTELVKLPDLIATHEWGGSKFELRGLGDSLRQLIVLPTIEPTYPSAVIYASANPPKQDDHPRLIGSLEGKGKHQMTQLPKEWGHMNTLRIVVQDVLKNNVITEFDLSK